MRETSWSSSYLRLAGRKTMLPSASSSSDNRSPSARRASLAIACGILTARLCPHLAISVSAGIGIYMEYTSTGAFETRLNCHSDLRCPTQKHPAAPPRSHSFPQNNRPLSRHLARRISDSSPSPCYISHQRANSMPRPKKPLSQKQLAAAEFAVLRLEDLQAVAHLQRSGTLCPRAHRPRPEPQLRARRRLPPHGPRISRG